MKIKLQIPLPPEHSQKVSAGVMLALGVAVIVGTKDYVPRTSFATSVAATPADALEAVLQETENQNMDGKDSETVGGPGMATPAQAEPAGTGSSVRLNMAYVYPDGAETGDVWDSYAGQACELLSELDSSWIAEMYGIMEATPEKLAEQLGISRNAVLGLYNPSVETQNEEDPDSWVIPVWTKNQVVFSDGDGNPISGYSNVKDIVSMASVYAYRQGTMDGQVFLDYCRQLWDLSHQYTVQMGEVYYCDGKCQLERGEMEGADTADGDGTETSGQSDGGNGAAGQTDGGNGAAGQTDGGNGAAGQTDGGNGAAGQTDGGNGAAGQTDGGNGAAGQSGSESEPVISEGNSVTASSLETGITPGYVTVYTETLPAAATAVPETSPDAGNAVPEAGNAVPEAGNTGEETSAESSETGTDTSSEETSPAVDYSDIKSRYTLQDVPEDWESYEGPARDVWEAVISAYGGQLPAKDTKTSGISEEDVTCPGHIDLEIKASILGIDGARTLFEADTLGNLTAFSSDNREEGEFVSGWTGWTRMNRHHVRCIQYQNWETVYGLPVVTTLYMGNPLSAAEISAYMDMMSGDITVFQREVIRQALQSVGCIPYYWGGKASSAGYDGNGFGSLIGEDEDGRRLRGLDCSGWINWVYWTALGTRLEYESTSGLAQIGTAITQKELQPGDIIVRTGTENSHVYLFLAWAPDGEMYVIHETSGDINNVTVSKLKADGPHYRRLLNN